VGTTFWVSALDDRDKKQVALSQRDRLTRYVGLVIGLILGWQIGARLADAGDYEPWGVLALLFAAVLGGLAFIIAPYVSVRFFRWLRLRFATVPAIDIVAAGVGLVVGGVLSSLLAFPTSLLPSPFGQTVPFLVAVVACGLSVFVVVLRKNDLASLIFRRQDVDAREEKILLDTSVIIDGRIVDLVRTGLVSMPLAVPRFILQELQAIANSDDSSRRLRGRRGIDALERLQREERVAVEIIEMDIDEEHEVDNKLIRLAKLSRYHVLTGDQNLERIARLQGVNAINMNTVSQALRPPVVAGEELLLNIAQPGREAGQGIGFLDDGTLIVVEDGLTLVGQNVRVIVTRTLQTGTGRMAFATLKEEVVA
jgi:uncharacterized protein YacL